MDTLKKILNLKDVKANKEKKELAKCINSKGEHIVTVRYYCETFLKTVKNAYDELDQDKQNFLRAAITSGEESLVPLGNEIANKINKIIENAKKEANIWKSDEWPKEYLNDTEKLYKDFNQWQEPTAIEEIVNYEDLLKKIDDLKEDAKTVTLDMGKQKIGEIFVENWEILKNTEKIIFNVFTPIKRQKDALIVFARSQKSWERPFVSRSEEHKWNWGGLFKTDLERYTPW